MLMNQPLNSKVSVPDGVLIRELGGESVLLNLASETYFGLDDVGSHMWAVLTASPSIDVAWQSLAEAYDVDPAQLKVDLDTFVAKLVDLGLLRVEAT